jgi:hypothetical protein
MYCLLNTSFLQSRLDRYKLSGYYCFIWVKIWREMFNLSEFHRESYTAFAGPKSIACGELSEVALKAKAILDRNADAQILIFNDLTSELVEIDFRGTPAHVLQRIGKRLANASFIGEPTQVDTETRRPGRPKLGVVAREVTLLPRHWEWLSNQPGGASVALRKLVEHARQANQSHDLRRRSQEAAYRFLSSMAGNEPGFEEAIRALFAGKQRLFHEIVAPWPKDVRNHAEKLVAAACVGPDANDDEHEMNTASRSKE